MRKITAAVFTCSILLLFSGSALAQHVPNRALSAFLDKQSFPKLPISREEVEKLSDWSSGPSDAAYYTSKSRLASNIRVPKDACRDRTLREEFVSAYMGYADDPLGNQILRNMTRQIVPNTDGRVDGNDEFEKILSRFGRNAKIEYDSWNLVQRNLKFIEFVTYEIIHHGEPAKVIFIVGDYGCLQVGVSYVGLEANRAKKEAMERSARGSRISDALK